MTGLGKCPDRALAHPFLIRNLLLLCLVLLTPQVMQAATITWIGGSSGYNFNTPKAWSTGTVPGPNDTAIISSGTFTVLGPITAGKVIVSTPYAPALSQSFNITGVWTFTNVFILRMHNDLSVQGGGSISVTGDTSIVGANITVYGNTTLSMNQVNSFTYPKNGASTAWTADGGRLNFPALKTISGAASFAQFLSFQATNGGTLNLPALTSINTEKSSGSDGYSGVQVSATYGSTMLLPALNSIEGVVSIQVGSGATVSFPSVTSYTFPENGIGADWLVDGTGSQLNFPALKTISTIIAVEQYLTLAASDGGTLNLPVLTSINATNLGTGVNLGAITGGSILAPQLSAFDSTGINSFTSSIGDDSTSSIFAPKLTAVTGVALSIHDASILSQLTAITGSLSISSGVVSMSDLATLNGLTSIEISGGAQVTFPKITNVTGSIYLSVDDYYGTGTELNFPVLTAITGSARIECYSGTMNFPVLTTMGNSELDATGGTALLPNLTTVDGMAAISAYGGSVLNFPAVTSFKFRSDGVTDSWSATFGGKVNFPALKTIRGAAAERQYLFVQVSENGTVSLPVLNSIITTDATGSPGFGGVWWEAYYGGSILAPLLSTFSDTSANPGSSLTDDSTSTISVPNLTVVNGVAVNLYDAATLTQFTTFTGSLSFYGSGTVSLPNITSLNGLTSIAIGGGVQMSFPNVTTAAASTKLSVDDTGDQGTELSFPELATLTGTISMSTYGGGTINLPVLTTITTTNNRLSTIGGTILLPELTSVNGLYDIEVASGSQISFPAVTSYTFPSDGTTDGWYVDGTGSQLNFPALATISGAASANQYLTLQASNQGVLNLPVLTSITKTDTAGLAGYSGVQLSAYTLGVVSAPVLTTFKDSGVDPQSSLTLDSTGGVLNLPVLLNTGIQGVTLNGIIPMAQTIGAFNSFSPPQLGAPYTLTPPTASSRLPVVVTVLSGPAKISGNVLTIYEFGPVVLAANQPGNLFYTAAQQVTTTVQVQPTGGG